MNPSAYPPGARRQVLRPLLLMALAAGLAACGQAATLAPAPPTASEEPAPSSPVSPVSSAAATPETSAPPPATPVATPTPDASAVPEQTPGPSASEVPAATPQPTAATAVPPRPSNVTIKKVRETFSATTMDGFVDANLTWAEPDGAATAFKVYGLTRCVNESKNTDGKPCLVPHQALRKSDLDLLATFDGTARSGAIRIRLHGEVTTNTLYELSDYYAIVIGAYNAKGESVLAIVITSKACWGCTW